MTCEEFSERVSDYIEGAINTGARSAVDRHASDCPSCKQMLKDVQTLTDRLAHLSRVRPSAGFDFALRSRILMETVAEKLWHRRLWNLLFSSVPRAALSLAAAAALALGVVGLLQRGPALPASGATSSHPSAERVQTHLEPIDRGTLKMLSQEESYEISGRFYYSQQDTLKSQRRQPKQGAETPTVRRVTVRF